MEYPIGSLVVTDELHFGDKAASLDKFENGGCNFFSVNSLDVKSAAEGKLFVKLVYDEEKFNKTIKEFPVKQLNVCNIFEYEGKRYKLTSARGSSIVWGRYLGTQETEGIAKLQGVAEETQAGTFINDNSVPVWINEKTIVKLVSQQVY